MCAWPASNAGLEPELPTVLEFGMQFSLSAQQYLALDAPMICKIAGHVLDHPDADVPESLSSPVGQADFTFVFGTLDRRPIGGTEGDA